jgi:hypothetical protein
MSGDVYVCQRYPFCLFSFNCSIRFGTFLTVYYFCHFNLLNIKIKCLSNIQMVHSDISLCHLTIFDVQNIQLFFFYDKAAMTVLINKVNFVSVSTIRLYFGTVRQCGIYLVFHLINYKIKYSFKYTNDVL